MTIEEAIMYWEDFLGEIDQMEVDDCWTNEDAETQREAAKMAISALRQQETVAKCNGLNEPLTNAQKIRSMSDEELAEFLWDFNLADVSTGKMGEFGPHMFRYRLKEWLQMPAEEDKYETD